LHQGVVHAAGAGERTSARRRKTGNGVIGFCTACAVRVYLAVGPPEIAMRHGRLRPRAAYPRRLTVCVVFFTECFFGCPFKKTDRAEKKLFRGRMARPELRPICRPNTRSSKNAHRMGQAREEDGHEKQPGRGRRRMQQTSGRGKRRNSRGTTSSTLSLSIRCTAVERGR